MKLVWLTILALFVSNPVGAQSYFEGKATVNAASAEAMSVLHAKAWRLACEAKRINCLAYRSPYVDYTLLPGGRYGQYRNGELAVQVDIRIMLQPVSLLVAVHEMIHYIQWASGQRNPEDRERYLGPCEAEAEAFTLAWEVNRKYQIVDPNAERRFQSWEQAKVAYPACVMGDRTQSR